jgi:hypothetical protein
LPADLTNKGKKEEAFIEAHSIEDQEFLLFFLA